MLSTHKFQPQSKVQLHVHVAIAPKNHTQLLMWMCMHTFTVAPTGDLYAQPEKSPKRLPAPASLYTVVDHSKQVHARYNYV